MAGTHIPSGLPTAYHFHDRQTLCDDFPSFIRSLCGSEALFIPKGATGQTDQQGRKATPSDGSDQFQMLPLTAKLPSGSLRLPFLYFFFG